MGDETAHPEVSAGGSETAGAEEALLALIRDLASEIGPGAGRRGAGRQSAGRRGAGGRDDGLRISTGSSLTEDAGLDSMARLELLMRIRERFGINLPDHVALSANTPGDILRAVREARKERGESASAGWTPVAPAAPSIAGLPPGAESAPSDLGTLVQVLRWHAERHPERPHIRLLEDGEEISESISYGDLLSEAERFASALVSLNLGPHPAVGIMLPTSRAFFSVFMGVLIAGGVPVPLYPPFRPDRVGEHLRRQSRILDNSVCRILLTPKSMARMGFLLKAQVPALGTVCSPEDLAARGGAPARWPEGSPDHLALLQYTSGSTGDPKGVMLSHANLLANIRAMGEATQADPEDVFVSWLPLYHDMGLIGAWMGSLNFAMPLVVMPPTAFLARPGRWLRAIHRYGGTLSAAPNFAYGICADRLDDAELEGLDLGRWRRAFNGAEPVSPKTLESFQRRFSAYGFRPEAMAPVYGLAENAVGLAFPVLDRRPRIEQVRRAPFERDWLALPADPAGKDVLSFVSAGLPLPGHEIRIVDSSGLEMPERRVGRIQFRGPSATRGYFRNPGADRRLFAGGWLETGDLGYISSGELFVSGRTKEVLIRGGRHFFPYEIEEDVGAIPGMRKGGVAAFGMPDEKTAAERLVVLAETRETDPRRKSELRRAIDEATIALVGAQADEVHLLPPRSIPKTPSGKIRRNAARQLLRMGKLGRARPVRTQIALEVAHAFLPAYRRGRRLFGEVRHAAWFWLLFGLAAPVAWLAAMFPIGNPLKRVRAIVRGYFRAAGVSIRIEGLENLPKGPAILVANHASWLDGPILVAALPPRFGVVAKNELRRNRLLRMALLRIGTVFVERVDPERSAADAARLAEMLAVGQPLVFFPEGTIRRAPGLYPFHLGAFVAAIHTGKPLVPVAITGSREALRGDQWFPRKAEVRIEILPAMAPAPSASLAPDHGASDWEATLELRRRCRGLLARTLGEPLIGGS